MHQSLHHLVADAPWDDEEMLAEVRRFVLPTMEKHVQWWHGLWMIQVFPSRESIPSESLGSTAVRSGNKITARRR